MKTLLKIFNKQIAVGTGTTVVESPPSYSISDGYLHRQQNGAVFSTKLSDRSYSLGLLQSFNREEAADLPFPRVLDPGMTAVLERYICAETDPVPSFPVMTIEELRQFAEIETYLGGDNQTFWEMYGFVDAHQALSMLREAHELYLARPASPAPSAPPAITERSIRSLYGSIDSQFPFTLVEAAPASLSLSEAILRTLQERVFWGVSQSVSGSEPEDFADSTPENTTPAAPELPLASILSRAFGFGHKDIDTLKALRWTAAPEVLLFLYGCLRDHLPLVEGREAVLSSRLTEKNKILHLKCLYQVHKMSLTPETLAAERAILSQRQVEGCYQEVCAEEARARGRKLSLHELDGSWADVFQQMADHREDSYKVLRLKALYEAGFVVATAATIATESEALLAATFRPRYDVYNIYSSVSCKGELLNTLYTVLGPKLSFDMVASERAKVLAATIDPEDKEEALIGLYEAAAPHLTRPVMASERAAIFETSLLAKIKSVIVMTMYVSGKEHVDGSFILSEMRVPFVLNQSDIRLTHYRGAGYCELKDTSEKDCLYVLRDFVAYDPTLSPLAIRVALCAAGKKHLTPQCVREVRERIWGVQNTYQQGKNTLIQWLYRMIEDPAIIQSERLWIRTSSLSDNDKYMYVDMLYNASRSHLTQELIEEESNDIRLSRLPDQEKTEKLLHLYELKPSVLNKGKFLQLRAEIREARMPATDKLKQLKKMYTIGADFVSRELVVSERETFLPDVDISSLAMLGDMYRLVRDGYPDMVVVERQAILDATVADIRKVQALSALYGAADLDIVRERTEILQSGMGNMAKAEACLLLYLTRSEALDPEGLESERTAIQVLLDDPAVSVGLKNRLLSELAPPSLRRKSEVSALSGDFFIRSTRIRIC